MDRAPQRRGALVRGTWERVGWGPLLPFSGAPGRDRLCDATAAQSRQVR